MPILALLKDCTGCAACDNICPKGAIEMMPDDRGFLHPAVSTDRCIECKRCEKVCPIIDWNPRVDDSFPAVFAAWHTNKATRLASSSGGAFSALAEEVLGRGGVVYGASWDGPRKVRHIRVDSASSLDNLRKSKYVPSEIADSYRMVKADIHNGIEVLFSGTPCQVAGLYAFLGKFDSPFLTTVDFICHGVPSPLVYWDYIDAIESKYDLKVQDVDFRSKKLGVETNLLLRVGFENGKHKDFMFGGNSFYRAFVGNVCLRRSCHNCRFNKLPRIADISLADFRGLGSKNKFDYIKDRYLGFTGLMANTSKGKKLLSESRNLKMYEREKSELYNSQPHLREPAAKSSVTEDFWADFRKIPYDVLAKKYLRMPTRQRLLNIVRVILRPRIYYFVARMASKR